MEVAAANTGKEVQMKGVKETTHLVYVLSKM